MIEKLGLNECVITGSSAFLTSSFAYYVDNLADSLRIKRSYS